MTGIGNINETTPTIRQYFDTFTQVLPPSFDTRVEWDSPKENYYIISYTAVDIVTGASENYKFGILTNNNVNLVTDFWGANGKRYDPLAALGSGPFLEMWVFATEQNKARK